MAITVSHRANNHVSGNHNSQSQSVNNNGDLLLVMIGLRDTAAANVSTVTYNSVSLTKVASASISNEYGSGLFHVIETWYLDNAPIGIHTLDITFSQNVNSSAFCAASISGEHASPIGNGATNSGNSNNPSTNLTTTAANSVVVGMAIMRRASGGSYSAGTDSSILANNETGAAAQSDITYCSLYEPVAAAGSMTIDCTNATSSAQWSMVAVEIKEAVAAGGGQPMIARARQVPGMRKAHGHQGW